MAFDADGAIQAAYIDFVSDCGAYPTPVAGRCRPRPSACCSPGPYRVPRAGFTTKAVYTNTVGRTRVPRPVAVRVARPRGAARHRGPADGHRPGRAAPAQPAAPRRAAVREPERHDLRQHLAARDVRAGAGDARLRRVPRRAGRGPQRAAATSASGSRTTSSRRRPASAYYATEAATIRIEPSGTVNVYIAGGSTGNSIETTVVQLTADALGVDIDDVNTIQGDTAVTGFGAGAAGSRSGSMTAGAVRETAGDPARAHRRHRRAQARGRRRGHRARRQPRERARHAVDRHLVRRARRARVLRPARRCRPACRPGSRRARGTPRDTPVDLGERHPRVHVRGRRRRPGRSRCCATS